jgi:environmental stress-induced protein Ves
MFQLIRQSQFFEGRWRNGMGVSWEIAALRADRASEFSWRLAKARIDGDVPFSIYPGMDRVFMQLEGQGLDLQFADGRVIEVHESFVPHSFSCDVPLNCKLLQGPCMDLNLFTARGTFRADVSVIELDGLKDIQVKHVTAVFFALKGKCSLTAAGTTIHLDQGDAALVQDEDQISAKGQNSLLFAGVIMPR